MPACPGCGRQFVENPQSNWIVDMKCAVVDKLLAERLSQGAMQECLFGNYALCAR